MSPQLVDEFARRGIVTVIDGRKAKTTWVWIWLRILILLGSAAFLIGSCVQSVSPRVGLIKKIQNQNL